MQILFVGATWLDVTALCIAVGAAACTSWLLPEPSAPVAYRLRIGFGAALALFTASTIVLCVARTLEMSGAGWSGLGRYLPLVVGETRFGALWRVRGYALAVAWVAALPYLVRGRLAKGAAVTLIAACAVGAFARAASGHAGDTGMVAVPVWIDMAHLVAAAGWVGPLLVLPAVVFPRLRAPGDVPGFAALFGRLSALAGAALALVVATGLYNAWHGLGRPAALWTSAYGRILLAKLGLVAIMVTIGAHNRWVKLPALRRSVPAEAARWVRRAARAVVVEAWLAVAVLLAAALLHHAVPPADRRPVAAVPAPAPVDSNGALRLAHPEPTVA